MAKIKRYRLVDGFTVDAFHDQYGIRKGGSWACEGARSCIFKSIFFRNDEKHEFEFSIYLCFPEQEKMSEWNDFDYILVLDEDFLQPYTPFYNHFGEEVKDYWCLETFIEKYNEWMDTLTFLREIRE